MVFQPPFLRGEMLIFQGCNSKYLLLHLSSNQCAPAVCCFVPITWRIIPVSKWLITMVGCCPLNRVVPLPIGQNGFEMGATATKHLLTGMILQV